MDGTSIDADREAADARSDWERRIYRRLTEASDDQPASRLPAPTQVTAESRVGHVRLDWSQVDGAAGYVIERTGSDDAPSVLLHGGADVPAVPGLRFADTGLDPATTYRYRVAATRGNDYRVGDWSAHVEAGAAQRDPGVVTVTVAADRVTSRKQPLWHMIGSERLTQMRVTDDGHGHAVDAEFQEALRIGHDELGITHVRAHGILHDDNAVVSRAHDGRLVFDFSVVDDLYDRITALGLRPVVELSFMPAAIARDPDATVFTYRGIISPPSDWAEWHAVVRALTEHLVERYGVQEVRQWGFEVWNEPNLEVFWTGDQSDYFRLYQEAVRAVKDVDADLPVGGPSTAAAEWVPALAEFARSNDLPLDFVSTHTYGNQPLSFRSALARQGFATAAIYWTEWGVGSTHYGPIHDSVAGAPFVLSGFKQSQDVVDRLSYWVISDHFEELGRGPRLFHNGFGLLTVGNLRKPRFWGLTLAEELGDDLLASTVDGDGADVLVEAWAGRTTDGIVDVLVWNSTINAALLDGDPSLDRHVTTQLTGLPAARYRVHLARVDATHSNIQADYPDDLAWPDAERFARMKARDQLAVEDLPDVRPEDGNARFDFEVPLPGVVRLRLTPIENS
ncbi:GH39 family glycosyl hydrolase [Nakamurella endophytica]|uniref:Fibronectin type-III domain-containing protein n=1 Tax=Nakamurella endophytica TaxID=1748367 RepID=A0A917SPN2_9ACTN|nr:xylan 1,4-beta-xylosidase [Nakamurella endophytica]GGL90151.1 hypothetical protein GCM10011594_07280 [Nakamurella endophytica]